MKKLQSRKAEGMDDILTFCIENYRMQSWSLELRSLQNGAIFSSSTRPKHEITNSGDEKELISGNLHAQT